ncbi:unnamed protein product, partial [Laminaria digitata]
MSGSGVWACLATGDTPYLCHQIAFIPLRRPTASPTPGALGNGGGGGDGEGEGARAAAAAVVGGGGGRGGGGGGVRSEPMIARMEKVECGGAVLSLSVSRDDRFVMANVRPFPDGVLETVPGPGGGLAAPDISNEIELQIWDVATKAKLFSLKGHHAFTTKECPFLIFAAQSLADPFGDYVCSGSEEHRVYVWHLRHRLLLGALK